MSVYIIHGGTNGVVDLHLHTGRTSASAAWTILTAARAAWRAHGGRAAEEPSSATAARAPLSPSWRSRAAPAYGGACSTSFVGGLNPAAVQASVAMGGRAVGCPPLRAIPAAWSGSARAASRYSTTAGGSTALVRVLEPASRARSPLSTATSRPRGAAVVPLAREVGVKKILVQHAEHSRRADHDHSERSPIRGRSSSAVSAHPARRRRRAHEPMLSSTSPPSAWWGRRARLLSSDLGQPENPSWPDGYLTYSRSSRRPVSPPPNGSDVPAQPRPTARPGLAGMTEAIEPRHERAELPQRSAAPACFSSRRAMACTTAVLL